MPKGEDEEGGHHGIEGAEEQRKAWTGRVHVAPDHDPRCPRTKP